MQPLRNAIQHEIRPDFRIAVIFGNEDERALGPCAYQSLQRICHATHIHPSQLPNIFKEEYDLFFFVGDGKEYDIPRHLYPRAWWVIDSFGDWQSNVVRASLYDWVFVGELDEAIALRASGVINIWWLPKPNEGEFGPTDDDRIEAAMEKVWTTQGLQSQYFLHARQEIVNLVPVSAQTILDVGCATGVLGGVVKNRQACQVYGIEPNQIAAEKARNLLDKVYVGFLEDQLNDLPDNFFDCIILADVLEHTLDPWESLRRIAAKLSSRADACIVLSIPNVSHWSVVLPLLRGEWQYADAGILDSTHMRFFTPAAVSRLIKGAGLAIRESQATIVPIPENVKVNAGDLLGSWIASGLANVYQILCVCVKDTSIG